MRVGIDAHALGTGAGGNETYMRALLNALVQHAPDLDLLAFVNPDFRPEPGAGPEVASWKLPLRSSYLRVAFALPWAAHRARIDVLHVQFNAPLVCPCPYVVSVHDICWKRFPHLLSPVDRHRLNLLIPGTLRRAARIFVLTHAMKTEIAAEYRLPLDRFDVVRPAVDPLFAPVTDEMRREAVRRKYGLPHDYVLYVGALQPRKNVARLAAAVARLRDRGLPHALAVVGKRAWLYGGVLAEIEALEIGDRLHFTGYVNRGDLPALYSGAAAFAYVSLYEGFGLPVLEALACGAPVLASTDAALQEVAGEAALYADPLDVDAIADGLERILTDTVLRDDLGGKGPARAREFSPQAMAAAALDGYHQAVASS